jgi:hypothetical protein
MRYRDIAENSDNGFNIEPIDWFTAATARINKHKATEQLLLEETTRYALEKVSSRRIVIIFESLILFLMIAVTYAGFNTIRLRSFQTFKSIG